MNQATVVRPSPFQAQVLAVPEDMNLFLGGGRGGGKSFAVMLLILRHCNQYKNRARVLVTRRRLKSLLQFAEELRALLRSAYGAGFTYNQNDNIFRLSNGATIALTHCESQAALSDTVQGTTQSLIVVDEAGEGPELPVIDALGGGVTLYQLLFHLKVSLVDAADPSCSSCSSSARLGPTVM